MVYLCSVGTVCLMYSCTAVKEYQKNKINDAEMELSAKKVRKFEQNFQVYREGASGVSTASTAAMFFDNRTHSLELQALSLLSLRKK